MSHQRAVRPRPAPRRGNVPAYVMASLLMAAEISLAIAYSVGFSLTARQTTSVLALGFLVPVMAVGVVLKAGWGGAGLMPIPFN
jgi:hypothetical protein